MLQSGAGVKLLGLCFALLWAAGAVRAQSVPAGGGATGGATATGAVATTSGVTATSGSSAAGASNTTGGSTTTAGPGAAPSGSFTLPTGPTGVLGSPTPAPAGSVPADAPVIGVSVNGSSVTSGETITVPPTQVADTSDPLEVTITNSGGTTLNLDRYAPPELYGGGSMMYLIDYTTYTRTIDPGQSSSFTVTFFPYQTGKDYATLVIISNDPRTPQFEINLAGTGLPMSSASDTSSQTYGAQ